MSNEIVELKQAVLALVAALGPEPSEEDLKPLMSKYPEERPHPTSPETSEALRKLDMYRDGMDSYSWLQVEKGNPALAETVQALRATINEWAERRDVHNRAQRREAIQRLKARWAYGMLEMIERGRWL